MVERMSPEGSDQPRAVSSDWKTIDDVLKWLRREEQVGLEVDRVFTSLCQASEFVEQTAREEQDTNIRNQAVFIARGVIEAEIPGLLAARRSLEDVRILLSRSNSKAATPLVVRALSDPTVAPIERGGFRVVQTKVDGLWIVQKEGPGDEFSLVGAGNLPFELGK